MIIMMTVRQDFYVGVMAQLDSIKFTCQDHHWSRLKITGEKNIDRVVSTTSSDGFSGRRMQLLFLGLLCIAVC